MKRIKYWGIVVILLLLAAGTISCRNQSTIPSPEAPQTSSQGDTQFSGSTEVLDTELTEVPLQEDEFIEVERITIEPQSEEEITINVGDSFKLTPVITPEDATNQQPQFRSSNEDVATVFEDGTVNAISPGTADIRCDVDEVSATCAVTVVIPVTGISVSTDRGAYKVGDQGSFTVVISPQDAADKTFTVSISGQAAEITGENTFSCNQGGEATITVTAANGVAGKQTITVVDLLVFANEVFRLTNIERENEGLPPFSQMSALTRIAQVRANEIIQKFSHDRPDGRGCFTAYNENNVSYNWAGENIAMGQRTPAEVVRSWMNSPGHRGNIVKSEFGHLGVGVAMGDDGKLYWVQNFMD